MPICLIGPYCSINPYNWFDSIYASIYSIYGCLIQLNCLYGLFNLTNPLNSLCLTYHLGLISLFSSSSTFDLLCPLSHPICPSHFTCLTYLNQLYQLICSFYQSSSVSFDPPIPPSLFILNGSSIPLGSFDSINLNAPFNWFSQFC